jgi:CheY-like chemotaxis protein
MVTPVAYRARIAVLDDDTQFIRLVERVLRDERVEVQPVTTLDLDEAVRVVSESNSAAALVDVYMYGSAQGFELVERLRSDPATERLAIIVTSGAHREIGKKAGFLNEHRCSVLLKPFDNSDLISRVRQAIDGAAPVAAAVDAPAIAATPVRPLVPAIPLNTGASS